MALHAFHARVRRVLIGGVLRLHHGVTGLSAEGHRIHVIDGAITQLAANDDVDHGRETDEVNQLAQFRVIPAESWELGRVNMLAAFALPLEPHAQRDENQSAEKRAGDGQKGEHAEIGILGFAFHRDGKKEEPDHGGGRDEHHAEKADPVVAEVDEGGQPTTSPDCGFVRRHA